MKNDCHSKVFNRESTFLSNIIFFVMGLILVIGSSIVYSLFYYEINPDKLLENIEPITILIVCVLGFFLGIVFIIAIFNLNNKIVRSVISVVMLLGGIIPLIILEPARWAIVILFISLVIFVFTRIFCKVFSTIITFLLFSFFIIPLMYFWSFIPLSQLTAVSYLAISSMLLLYNIFGIQINQIFLRLITGKSQDAIKQLYNREEMKNQINLLYLIAFVILNVLFLYNSDISISLYSNCINNSLITGVCITNVNWRSLIMKD